MVLLDNQIVFFLPTGQFLSGGGCSDVLINTQNIMNNLYPDLEEDKAVEGVNAECRCIFVKNLSETDTAVKLTPWISQQPSSQSHVLFGIGAAGINGHELQLPTPFMIPPNIEFYDLATKPAAPMIVKIGPKQTLAFWFNWKTVAHAQSETNVTFTFSLEVEREPEPDPGAPINCPAGQVLDPSTGECVIPLNCPTGTTYNPITRSCVVDDDDGTGGGDDEETVYNVVAKFGSSGTGNGQFETIEQVTVDANNNIFVVDSGAGNIQKFSASGAFLSKFGTEGTADGQFSEPYDVKIDALNFMWEVDRLNNRIQKLDSTGAFVSKITTITNATPTTLNLPESIAFDRIDGAMYIADTGNHRIIKLDSALTFVWQIGTQGSADGQFETPYGLAVGPDRNIYVSDRQSARIQVFDRNGVFLRKWGEEGLTGGQLTVPKERLYVDSSNRVYQVNGTSRPCVIVYDKLGLYLRQIGDGISGNGDGQFNTPNAVVINGSGQAIVTDSANFRVQIFTPTTTGGPGGPGGSECDECPANQHCDPVTDECVPDVVNPPPTGTIKNVAFGAVGDFDCSSDSDATWDNLYNGLVTIFPNAQGFPLGWLLALGDFSYNDGDQSCWIDAAVTMDDMYPNNIFPIIGNHDDEEDGEAVDRTIILNTFGKPSEGYYAFTKENIRFIMMDTQRPLGVGSPQYNFVNQQLQQAHTDPLIKWKVVCYHKPSVTSSGNDHGALISVANAYHALFTQYQVDFVLSGHNHNSEVTYQIKFTTGNTDPTDAVIGSQGSQVGDFTVYQGWNGTIYMVLGGGGRAEDTTDADDAFMAFALQEFAVGLFYLRDNGRTMRFVLRRSDDLFESYLLEVRK